MSSLALIPVGCLPAGRLDYLAEQLQRLLKVTVTTGSELDPIEFYELRRDQYRSDRLLERLAVNPCPQSRVLGVTECDLFIPVLTFLFGEAQLGGRAALVSSYRLRNELYGLPADRGLLEERLVKEAMHELGHTYGLVHCHNTSCVMQTSTYAELVDLKPATFCAGCERAYEAFKSDRWAAPIKG